MFLYCMPLSVNDLNGFDHRLLIFCNRSVIICRFGILADLIYHIHTVCYMSESCIISIQICTVCLNDKESELPLSGSVALCHGDGSSCMGNIILYTIAAEFSLDVLIGSACSITVRISTLDHKSINNAVKKSVRHKILPVQASRSWSL